MTHTPNQTLTTKERPRHHAIGMFFYGWDQQVHYCAMYDPRADFWMTNVIDADHRRHAVSPGAIGRTYHEVGTTWKPRFPEAALGREYFAIDTRLSPDEMRIVKMTDSECFGLNDRVALFVWEPDAKKFITRVKAAAVLLAEEKPSRRRPSTS